MLLDNLEWLGHASFRLKTAGGNTVYIDPYRVESGPPADVILITHDHFDHFSRDDVQRLAKDGTQVIAPPTVAEQLQGPVLSTAPDEAIELSALEVRAVAAYNTNKLDSQGRPFHPREAGWVGYLLNVGGERLYHSGDTDVIPEMDRAVGVDIALLPVSGTYVMTAVEAAEAARRIEPQVAVPMHWGALIGSRADAEEFALQAPVEVKILDKVGDPNGTQSF